ncbi:MAG TPA: hypothetical protein VGQ39_04325 [Pyrinomonadaceae bacterium]|jgi:hypothetical protein|nr:hypothetical protein [Pyrinomonadaceae bacterium]
MINSGFSRLKWTALVAVLALTVIAGGRPSTATNQPPLPAALVLKAELANEERVLAKYFDDLIAYQKQVAEIGKKESLLKSDLDPLQRRSEDLKGRLSGVQNVIREIVKKLKAADEWNDLDITTAAKITDAGQKSFFQQTSFKEILEESSNSLSSHGNQISLPLDNLRKKLTSRTASPYGEGADFQIVRATYETPAPTPLAFVSLACSIGRVRSNLIHRLGGIVSNATNDQISCACGFDIAISSGAACPARN